MQPFPTARSAKWARGKNVSYSGGLLREQTYARKKITRMSATLIYMKICWTLAWYHENDIPFVAFVSHRRFRNLSRLPNQ